MDKLIINETLVQNLVASQFPQWKDLPIQAVIPGGWDNKTFRLGEHMLIRMPSSIDYASQVEKEQLWLPILAPKLPLPIPKPIAHGNPSEDYPWPWSIYRWLQGLPASIAYIADLRQFAKTLGQFLITLQSIDSSDGPLAGLHSFYRGGLLSTYDGETRQAIAALKDKIDINLAVEVWETALATAWLNPKVWVHGDISAGNLLVHEGSLSAVIDFGQLAVGDPACDLAIAWTMFKDESREIFRTTLSLDADTWARGRAWALWKSVIIAAGFTHLKNIEVTKAWGNIAEILAHP